MHYDGTIWRPPYEAASLLIQVTAGCTHHACKFCTLYEELPFAFRLSPVAEVEEDLAEASRLRPRAERVFFTGANPFVLHTDKLKALARLVKTYYPGCQTIGCFGRITDVQRKTTEELKELRALGYNGITFGVETGDGAALAFMKKGYQPADILTECRKLDQAGIDYNFFYLTGISGAGRGEQGAKASAAIFNQCRPKVIDASMLTIQKGSALYREIQSGAWQEESELEKLAELRTLIAHLTIATRFATDGASNLIQVRGILPADQKRLVQYLDRLIATADEALLRAYRVSLKHL